MFAMIINLLTGINFGKFFRSPLGKVASGIALAVAAYIGFNVWLSSHEATIREEARTEFNLEQEEALREAQVEFDRQMEELRAEQAARLESVVSQRDALQQQSSDLMARIRSGEFQGSNDEASEVLRETIRRLQERATQ